MGKADKAEESTVDGFSGLLDRLANYTEATGQVRESLLANLAMISEIPAPTFGEQNRVRFLQDRFSESGLQNCSTDEVGNALGILNGIDPQQNILLVAHVDTPFKETTDHTISLQPDSITGAGVGDNSLGVAVLAALPAILEHYGITLQSNLVLMGASRGLGRGNLEGLRFFLNNNELPIRSGVCVEGVQLGRLSYTSLGMLRGEINCRVPEEYDWSRFGASGAITIVNEVINRMSAIALPTRPATTIVFGTVEGGTSFGSTASHAVLRFEVRSESGDTVRRIGQEVEDICGETSARTRSEVNMDIVATREPGGIHYGHPLARSTREIMNRLEIEPRISPSVSELAAFIDAGIPAVTLGLTTGEHLHRQDETVRIEPIFTGIAQVLGVLLAIDEGYCNEPE